MYAGKALRGAVNVLVLVFGSVAGWLLLVPLALLVPKRRDWIAVIGKQDGEFLDNTKFFFLQGAMVASGLRLVWVTERQDVARMVREGGCEAMIYPGLYAAWFLLRCGSVVVDEAAWYRRGRVFLLLRAATVQLWHGSGFKRTEADQWRHMSGAWRWASQPAIYVLRLAFYRFTGRRVRYSAFVCTSEFYRDQVFRPAFLARLFPIFGYARNDFGQSLSGPFSALAWKNVNPEVVEKLPAWRKADTRLVIVAPTFRESGAVPMQLDAAALQTIDRFGAANNVEFVFKFHPFERNVDHIHGQHFHVCVRDSDIYPLLPEAAALVTDYSSIATDYLLVNKPLLFLIPSDDDYAGHDRQLQFDPRTMMPGPIVSDWPSVCAALETQWTHDDFIEDRAVLCSKAFDGLPQAECVPRLLAFMRERDWVRGS